MASPAESAEITFQTKIYFIAGEILMKAWQIFRHALRQLTGNLKDAVFISAIPFGSAAVFAAFMVGNLFLRTQSKMSRHIDSGQVTPDIGKILLVSLALTVMFLWVAVAWHRFVLRSEQPGLIPRFHGGRMAAYFGKGLLLGLLLAIPAVILMVIVGVIVGSLPPATAPYAMLLVVPAYIVLSAFALRLATILPGTALGVPTSLVTVMTETGGNNLTYLGLAGILWILSVIIGFVTQLLAMVSQVLALVWEIPTQWFLTMLSLSILTTLYGYYIEKRELH
ncbi:hypothetical protein [Rhizobium oryzicola]|uniref:ABC transporter permease n=1 Tax=Rhizobium oryzicola TaxID=1232668 RepID=A0ABT8SZV3_9HYPH|nr:hypothetical protein [Rhizobium oryzicola]MDO1583902.1 hypothetical protein [Rhizobium oryzicola]